MSDKIWKLASQPNPIKSPYEILLEYGRRLKEDTNDLFWGDIVQTVEAEGLLLWSFYVIVPELRNYSHRLFEVKQLSIEKPYPVTMTLFAFDPKNNQIETNVGFENFKTKLEGFITHPLTAYILNALKNQSDIFKEYGEE